MKTLLCQWSLESLVIAFDWGSLCFCVAANWLIRVVAANQKSAYSNFWSWQRCLSRLLSFVYDFSVYFKFLFIIITPKLDFFLHSLYLCGWYVCVWVRGGGGRGVCVWPWQTWKLEENIVDSVLSFYCYVGSWNYIQVSRCFYLLSILLSQCVATLLSVDSISRNFFLCLSLRSKPPSINFFCGIIVIQTFRLCLLFIPYMSYF